VRLVHSADARPALAIDGLAKRFGEKSVLCDVSLALPTGEIMALVGPSAGGKSVLIKCAAGLLRADAGRIDLLGTRSIRDWTPLRPRIGVLFQRNALFDGMRVWENVAFPLRRHGMGRNQARAEAFRLLARVGLDERAGEGPPSDLSGGMQKRVALARAVAGAPELLLLDDPTAGLDPVLSAAMEALIHRLVDHSNASALIVTADITRLAERFDRLAILDKGHIQWSGPTGAVTPGHHSLLQAT